MTELGRVAQAKQTVAVLDLVSVVLSSVALAADSTVLVGRLLDLANRNKGASAAHFASTVAWLRRLAADPARATTPQGIAFQSLARGLANA